ncbi:BolA protein [Acrodontium crateriforme]|uniref:BolA protein n=1 Tax=Acrodontium crateriforme TaxID=150365 RepID=A0AAQ3M2Z9_9PEZI|nr:BolA protein [Acrodontium crateriforme]
MSASTHSHVQGSAPDFPVANGLVISPEHISSAIKERLGAVHVEISDLSGGCGQMLEAIIVSPQFAKKTTLARHRLVNAALKEEIAVIHAWTPKCFTLEEWEKKKGQLTAAS